MFDLVISDVHMPDMDGFKLLELVGLKMDLHLFNALLRTLSQEKSMSDARNVYRTLKYEFQVNRQTFNILLSGWESAEDAEAFFAEMRELGVEPDQVTYNSLIDCHCKKWDVEKAYKLLDEMWVKDICPDVITYTSLIGGLGLIGTVL